MSALDNESRAGGLDTAAEALGAVKQAARQLDQVLADLLPAAARPRIAGTAMFRWSTRFRVREYVRCSLWVVPMLGGLAGVVLSYGSAKIDESVTVPLQWQYTQNTATTLLTTIVGAMVGLLGLVVTIGVLVVQQATSSLSPRFMRLWYSQRLQKAVLATFACTFAFAFGNLRRVNDTFVPDVGVTLAGIACSISLIMLLFYLDSFTHHLRPVAVASLVARRGQRVVTEARAVLTADPDLDLSAHTTGDPVLRVMSRRAGAVQAVHTDGLLAQAERHDCTLVLTFSVGDFVAADVTVIEVYGRSAPRPEALLGCLAFGVERTHRAGPGLCPADPGRHRDPSLVAGGERPHDGRPGPEPSRDAAADPVDGTAARHLLPRRRDRSPSRA